MRRLPRKQHLIKISFNWIDSCMSRWSKISFLVAAIIVNVVLLLSFSVIAIPSWQEELISIKQGLLLIDFTGVLCLLALKIAAGSSRKKSIKSSSCQTTVSILSIFIIFLIFGAIFIAIEYQKNHSFIYCGDEYDSYKFPKYGKTFYLQESFCRDGLVLGGPLYVQETSLPFMKPLLTRNSDLLELRQSQNIVEIFPQPVKDGDRFLSKIATYHLETGKFERN